MLKDYFKHIKEKYSSFLIVVIITSITMYYFAEGIKTFLAWFFLVEIKDLITNVFHNQTFISACTAGAIYFWSRVGVEVVNIFLQKLKSFKDRDKSNA